MPLTDVLCISLLTRDAALHFCLAPQCLLLSSLFWQPWEMLHSILLKCSHLQSRQCTEEVIFINDRKGLAWIELCLLFCKKGAPLYISSVTVAFLSFNNAQLFPWKFQVPWTGEFCIIMFLPNSDLCFPSPAHKGLITYCQLWGKPQSSTVAQQIGLCWLMVWLALRFA